MSTSANDIYEQARRLFQQHQHAEALALLELPSVEEDGKILFARARCLAHLGRVDEALACCDRLRTTYNDTRWMKLAEKIEEERARTIAASEGAASGTGSPAKSRPSVRLTWAVALAAVLIAVAGAVAAGKFVSVSAADQGSLTSGSLLSTVASIPKDESVPLARQAADDALDTTDQAPVSDRPADPIESPKLALRGSATYQEALGLDDLSEDQYSALRSDRLRLTVPGKTRPAALELAAMMTGATPEGVQPAAATAPSEAMGPPAPHAPVASIIDLQPFKTQQRLTNARGDSIVLTNLNPNVGAWYILEVNIGGQHTVLHLETPALQANPQKRPVLSLYRDGLRVTVDGAAPQQYPLWAGNGGAQVVAASTAGADVAASELNPAPVCEAILAPNQKFTSPLTAICDGFVLVRAQKPGSSTRLEMATDLMRETRVGEWLVARAKPYLIPEPEVGEDHRGAGAAEHAGNDGYPRDARVDEGEATLYSSPQNLAIASEAPDNRLYYGKWYKTANHPHVFVALMKPTVAEKAILSSYGDRVGAIGSRDKRRRETDALVYLVAYDLGEFRFGYAVGADHPRVEWSSHAGAVKHEGKGPDGFDTKSPLATIGAVPPYISPFAVGVFTGGFKREHGAFGSGPLSKVNKGSHFGFMEQGVIFSRLQPNLATLVIARDGSLTLGTWPENGDALLPKIGHARQNCVPVIEGLDANGLSVPGRLVNDWGAGAWSGDQNGDCVTLRASVALQEYQGRRFLICAYFTGATPNAMARVFQAFNCKYAMLLDMNTPNYCYAALYVRDAEGKVKSVEYLHKDMTAGNGTDGSFKFLEKDDTRDFFYVWRNP